VAVTQAAAEFGVMHCLSTATLPSLEETASATDSPKIFQLYVHGDDAWVEDLIHRVKDAGYASLALTVDVAHYSRRERPMLSRYIPPTRRVGAAPERRWQAQLTWDSMDRIRDLAGLPFMLKGVQTAEDAEIAVQHGVDFIWVSNHGGRQIDHGLAAWTRCPRLPPRLMAGRASSSTAACSGVATFSRRLRWGPTWSPSGDCRAGVWPPRARTAWCACSRSSKMRWSAPWA